MTDYSTYRFTPIEFVLEIIKSGLLLGVTSWLFFDSISGMYLLLPFSVVLINKGRKKKLEDRIVKLREDFREFLLSFTSSVQAGYTIEQAVITGARDLRRLYGCQNRPLLTELEWMESQMKLRVLPAALFDNLAHRSGLEEIRSFAVVLEVGRRQGGNLVSVICRTAEQLNKKMQVQLEVEQAIAGKVMEKNIMTVMPYGMLLYLKITNGAYMEALFGNLYGIILMAVCLLVLWAAGRWADYIMAISV